MVVTEKILYENPIVHTFLSRKDGVSILTISEMMLPQWAARHPRCIPVSQKK
jgi:hypothetical protein